nr:MAG TPA: hypothetical protein [Caudoviricetes sp.]
MGLRQLYASPLHPSSSDTVFIVALWYTVNLRLTSTYCRKTTRFYASYARITHLLLYAYRLYPQSLHQYPTYKRKASRKAGWIGFCRLKNPAGAGTYQWSRADAACATRAAIHDSETSLYAWYMRYIQLC